MIDYDLIDQAAHELTEAGIAVTVDNIRHALGNKGSKSTLAPLVKRWKENHQVIAQTADLGIPSGLFNAMKGVYDGLRVEFGQKIAENLAEFEAKISELSKSNQHLSIQNQDLTKENGKIAEQNQSLKEAQAEMTSQLTLLTTQNQHLQANIDFLSQENQGQKNHFQQQYQTLQNQFLHYQNHAEQQRQVLQTHLQNTFEQSKQAQQDKNTLKMELERILNAQNAQHLAESTQLLEKITAQNIEIQRLKRENANKSRHHWQAKYKLK